MKKPSIEEFIENYPSVLYKGIEKMPVSEKKGKSVPVSFYQTDCYPVSSYHKPISKTILPVEKDAE